MAITRQVLGINARNFLYIRVFNRRKFKLLADDKLATKQRLIKHDVPTPALLATFKTLNDARSFDFSTLPKNFVLKPAHGYGGKGILVVGHWNGETGKTPSGKTLTKNDIESEVFGILDGGYSLNNLPDTAFIEETVMVHQFYKKYIPSGLPDIRVIVFNDIPIMAMMRLPTIHTDGKANLHMGALGIGIDMRTGITTHGVIGSHNETYIPGKKIKVQGIRIPGWNDILTIALQAAKSSKLGFVGIDIVIDQDKGPLVLEVNARPGLSIQIANHDSLRTRLERVAHLKVSSIEKGIEIATGLFADEALEKVQIQNNILGVIEKVTIYGEKSRKTVRAKIDTGAYRTSIDVDLVHDLDLDKHHKLIHVRSGSGRQKRRTVKLKFKLRDKEINTIATYTERSHLRFPIIIGRKDIKDFLVDPSSIPEGVKVK